VNWIVRIRLMLGVMLIGLLAGCGGGGAGSAGPYTITLRADKTSLPLNIANEGARIGGRYTTTLYVEARDSAGRPIPGGDEAFACNVTSSLDSGYLYYLDGSPEHQTTTTLADGTQAITPNAYRSIVLDSNSGGSSFHFHAWNIKGTATIRCSVTEPTGNIQRSASVTIQVGESSGGVSQLVMDTISSPGYIYAQGLNGPTQMQIQANLVDEAGQPIANPTSGKNNLQVRIVPVATTTADDAALLRGVNGAGSAVSGSAIHVRSINGQAQFTLVSGNTAGTVMIEAISDLADNDVSNGIAQPLVNYYAATVVTVAPGSTSGSTLAIATESLPAATGNIPYAALLSASGGTPPYTWSTAITSEALFSLGLTLGETGTISGTPTNSTSGSYSFIAQVRDSKGFTQQKTLAINYTAPPTTTPVTPVIPALVVSPTSGSGAAGTDLTFVITGGSPSYAAVTNNSLIATVGNVSFTGSQYRVVVTLVGTGSTSVVITDSSGKAITIPITVSGGAGTQALTVTPSVGGSVAIGQQFVMMVSGGTAPYTVTSTNTSIGTVAPTSVATSGGTFTFTPVKAGTVDLIVRDTSGSIQTVTMTVTQPGGTLLTVVPSTVNWKTTGCTAGSPYTDFVVYGGTPGAAPTQYTAISTSPLVADIVLSGGAQLRTDSNGNRYFRVAVTCGAEGDATIVIRDSVNATITSTFTLQVDDPALPAAPTVSPASLSANSPNSLTRDLVFVVSGGTPNYAVVSSDSSIASIVGPVAQTDGQYRFTARLQANSAGVVNFIVTDGNGVSALSTMTVTDVP
jgi:hypothetical protein